MAKLVLPDEGLPDWVDHSLARNMYVGLIKAALAADVHTTLGEVAAVESDFPGYARALYPAAKWIPAVLLGDVAKSFGANVIFAFSGGPFDGQDIYGYFIVNQAQTKLLMVQMRAPDPPAPINLASPSFQVNPGYGFFSQYTS